MTPQKYAPNFQFHETHCRGSACRAISTLRYYSATRNLSHSCTSLFVGLQGVANYREQMSKENMSKEMEIMGKTEVKWGKESRKRRKNTCWWVQHWQINGITEIYNGKLGAGTVCRLQISVGFHWNNTVNDHSLTGSSPLWPNLMLNFLKH